MNYTSSNYLSHQASSRSMICPLVKLGRLSPPNADEKYELAVESGSPGGRSPVDYDTAASGDLFQHQGPYIYTGYPVGCPEPKHPSYYVPGGGRYQVCAVPASRQQHGGLRQQHGDPRQQHGPTRQQRAPGGPACTEAPTVRLSNLSLGGAPDDAFWNEIDNEPSDRGACPACPIIEKHHVKQYKWSGCHTEKNKMLAAAAAAAQHKLGKSSSPSFDQGYHTLLSPSPAGSSGANVASDYWTSVKGKRSGLSAPGTTSLSATAAKGSVFDRLSDELVVRVLAYLPSYDLSACARVCRRWEALVWRPALWRTLTLSGADKTARTILKQLAGQGQGYMCLNVERAYFSDGARVSDREVVFLARRCPELTHLQVHGCTEVSNYAIHELITRCINLHHLDITGCTNVSSIMLTPGPEPPLRLALQYLDLTDCVAIDDGSLRTIVRSCPQLVYLYLRRCVHVTDAGLKHVPSFCSGLREFSVSDCSKITDFGLYELAKLGATLRYLSVAKCDQVSDAGLKVIARRCYKLRYLNARGCEAVSDDAITVVARSCTRLRALDVGKCDISDAGLKALAESCPNIKKLSLRNCDLVTDRGIQCIAYYCRGLQQLNIQDCQISIEGYRAVKQYCRRCIIEHTNPGFF